MSDVAYLLTAAAGFGACVLTVFVLERTARS